MVFLLLVLSFSGVAVILFSTRWGIGIAPDSAFYIFAARSLSEGRGLADLPGGEEIVPFTNWPPLYPVLLAAIDVLGMDLLRGARWLNALLFGANIFLVGLAIHRHVRGTSYSPILGCFLALTSIDMLSAHSAAFTEPLFVFLGLSALLFLSVYLENGKNTKALFAAAAAAALGSLARLAGLALVTTGALGILLYGSDTRRRVRDAFIFGAIASLPVLLWMIRNILVSGNAVSKEVAFHPISTQHIHGVLLTFSSWLAPVNIPGPARAMLLLGLSGACVAFLLSWMRYRTKGMASGIVRHSGNLPHLLGIFIGSYFVLLIGYISFLHGSAGVVDGRILLPVYIAALILVLSLAPSLLRSAGRVRYLHVAVVALSLVFAGSYLVRAAVRISAYHNGGRGFTHRSWRQSETIQLVKTLPSGVRIFSNGADAIYILAGRRANFIPVKHSPSTLKASPTYPVEMAAMKEKLASCSAVLVYFRTIDWRRNVPSEAELAESLPLRLIGRGTDGSVFVGEGCP